jgi:hypothetical protein
MSMVQLVYTSQPFGFDVAILNGILVRARANNARDNITGCLICRADLYMQLLEGPPAAVAVTWSKIQKDDRHVTPVRHIFRPIETRMFPEWAMRDDPAKSWMWTQTEVNAGAVERASEDDILAVFARIKAEAPAP